MIQKLQITLAQVKAGNTSENLLNETRQNICSLHRGKEILENLCNNIMSSVQISIN